jgi:hypothetical protein
MNTNLINITCPSPDIHKQPWYPLERATIQTIGIGGARKQLSKIQFLGRGYGKKSRINRFSLFPMEIQFEIAPYLPIVDFLALRSAILAMAPIFWHQSIWKECFRINGDRVSLACLLVASKSRLSKNWRSIYRCTERIDQQDLLL